MVRRNRRLLKRKKRSNSKYVSKRPKSIPLRYSKRKRIGRGRKVYRLGNKGPSRSFVLQVQKAITPPRMYGYSRSHLVKNAADLKSFNYLAGGLKDTTVINLLLGVVGVTDQEYGTKIQISNQEVVYQVANMTNALQYLKVYKVMARDNMTLATSVDTNIIAAGFDSAGLSNATTQELSVSLFDNVHFTRNFKVLASTVIRFEPGENKVFSLKSSYPYNVDPSDFISGSPAALTLPTLVKGSISLLFETMPTVTQDATTEANIGTGISEFAIVQTQRYRWLTLPSLTGARITQTEVLTEPAAPRQILDDDFIEAAINDIS